MTRTIQTICRTATIAIQGDEAGLSDDEIARRYGVPIDQPAADTLARLAVVAAILAYAAGAPLLLPC